MSEHARADLSGAPPDSMDPFASPDAYAGQRGLQMKRLVAVLSAVVAVLALSGVGVWAPAGAADQPPLCAPQVKGQVADVTEHVRNLADLGVDGHVWALTEDDIRIQIWRVGTHHFCVRRDFHGTFRSFAGVSPNLTGTVSAGVTGTENGTDWAVFTGTWAPRVRTSGLVGDVDLGCTQDGACAAHRGVGYLFFADDFQALHVRQYDFVYDAGAQGVWHESSDASQGDITG